MDLHDFIKEVKELLKENDKKVEDILFVKDAESYDSFDKLIAKVQKEITYEGNFGPIEEDINDYFFTTIIFVGKDFVVTGYSDDYCSLCLKYTDISKPKKHGIVTRF